MIWESNYDAMLRWALKGADTTKVTSIGNAAHDLSGVYEIFQKTLKNKKLIDIIKTPKLGGC